LPYFGAKTAAQNKKDGKTGCSLFCSTCCKSTVCLSGMLSRPSAVGGIA
jgi:hypothetical protein